MGRNDPLLRRLYARGGGPSRAAPGGGEPPPYGILPALWLIGLVAFGLFWAIVAIASLCALVRTAPADDQLHAWGILQEAERPWLLHDHSAQGDGTSGCVAVDDRLIRFDARAATAELELRGADVSWVLDDAARVVVRQGDEEITCPFGLGEGAETFADVLRVAAARRPPRVSTVPRDPRL